MRSGTTPTKGGTACNVTVSFLVLLYTTIKNCVWKSELSSSPEAERGRGLTVIVGETT